MRLHSTTSQHHACSPRRHSHSRRGGLRGIAQQLSSESIEQIARRVVQLLRQNPQPHDNQTQTVEASEHVEPDRLLTAAQLARKLGVNRSWVYQHAHKLGAITLGNGPKPRLRFDPQTTTALLAADNPPAGQPTPELSSTVRRGRPRRPAPPAVPLLPVHPRGVRGLLARLPIPRGR